MPVPPHLPVRRVTACVAPSPPAAPDRLHRRHPETDAATTTAPAGAASATPSAGTGAVASCVLGVWRSTALTADPNRGTANADLTGGAGIGVTIEPTGATTIDFSNMEPITFTASIAGAESAATSPTPAAPPAP